MQLKDWLTIFVSVIIPRSTLVSLNPEGILNFQGGRGAVSNLPVTECFRCYIIPRGHAGGLQQEVSSPRFPARVHRLQSF